MRSWVAPLAGLALVIGSSPALALDTVDDGGRYVVPGTFVSTSAGAPSSMSGFSTGHTLLDHVVLEMPADGAPHRQAAALSETLGFDVEPMVMYRFAEDPTDEPRFGEQWGLDNRGQTGGTPGADIDVVPVWQWTRGAGVVIAIVDSGVDRSHPDLSGRTWRNADEIPDNGQDDDGNGFVDDVYGWDFGSDDNDPIDEAGHGTSVASVAVAAADGTGMSGVAPRARVMSVRTCDAFGCPASAVAAGVVYAVDNGADVVNVSLGAPGTDPLVTAAVEYAASKDVLVVSAAGNAGTELDANTPWTPASIDSPNLVAVAATDATDTLSASSNYGAAIVDVAAPGAMILTAVLDGAYEVRSGTSFAAPHVAGVAALMHTMDPSMSSETIADLMVTTSSPVDALRSLTISNGRLDAHTAVQTARFRDIVPSEFADDAMWAAGAGITIGCGDHLFCPDTQVSRGQMAAFLRRALDLPDSPIDAFADDDGTEFEGDIDAIAAAGITTGCTDDRFCADAPVTRGQMAALLVRAYDIPTVPWFDRFVDDDASVFEPDIEALAAAGITQGCDPPLGTRFCPESAVTRGQMVALMHRVDD